jgi:magnesium-transporting ATPase (P-type)
MAQPSIARTRIGIWIVIAVLLAASLVGTLWVPFYNHLTPVLWGFPFFYWYQLMWVLIVAILSAIAYVLTRWAQRNNTAPVGATSAPAPDKGPGEAT